MSQIYPLRTLKELSEAAVAYTGYVDGRYRFQGKAAEEWIPDVLARIIERFNPLKVVLFGSQGRGETGPDSDIDLLVILDVVADRRKTAAKILSALADLPAPVDVVPTDPSEIQRRGHLVGNVICAALRDGKTLYDRTA